MRFLALLEMTSWRLQNYLTFSSALNNKMVHILMQTNPSKIALIAAVSFVFFLIKKHKDIADSRTSVELKTIISAPKKTHHNPTFQGELRSVIVRRNPRFGLGTELQYCVCRKHF